MIDPVSTSTLYAIPKNAVVTAQKQLLDAETEMTTGQLADPVQSLGSQFGLYQTLQSQSAEQSYQASSKLLNTINTLYSSLFAAIQ